MDVGCHVLLVIVVFWLSFFGCLVFGNSVFFSGLGIGFQELGKLRACCLGGWLVGLELMFRLRRQKTCRVSGIAQWVCGRALRPQLHKP